MHYTDHSCRVADPLAPHAEVGVRNLDRRQSRHSWFGACLASRSRPTPGRLLRFTTDRTAVTCERCLDRLAERDRWDAERPADALPVSDAARQLDAFEQCCRHRGAPPMLSAIVTAAREADERYRFRRDVNAVVGSAMGMIASRALGKGEPFEAWLEKTIERFSPEVLDRIHPLLHGVEIATQAAEAAAQALVEGIEATAAIEAVS